MPEELDQQLTVLNCADGVNEVVAGLLAQGIAIYDSLRKTVESRTSPHPYGAPITNGDPSVRRGHAKVKSPAVVESSTAAPPTSTTSQGSPL